MKRKKRILFVNEFSQLSTGFATYTKYILPLLHATGKYDIAELAVYCSPLDPRINEVPWKVYPNEPHPQNPDEQAIFNSNQENQFGKWKFEEVLLDFQADIIFSMSDVWMNGFINKTPLRRHFKFACMPTCDGEPQKDEWVEEYIKYDVTTAYSLWAKNVLEKQSQGQIKVADVTSPGTDIVTFHPLKDRNEVRNQLGLKSDLIIFQTVMRNQPRKLFPDLMKAFNTYLSKCSKEIAQKSFLHLHTSQPDVGWDLPDEIRKHKLSHKVLFTFMCDQCSAVYIDFYRGDRCPCRNCKQKTARCPNTSKGIDRDVLAKVMGIADLYIQYSCSEGWSLPPNDAKACGVPCILVEYSAMTEQCHNGGAWPIKVLRFCQEPQNQTNQLRAFPDNDHCAELMLKFINLSHDEKTKMRLEARKCVEDNYNWVDVAKKWERIFDSIPDNDLSKTWLSPPQLKEPQLIIPNNMSNEQFIQFCYEKIKQEPEEANSIMAKKTVALLNIGYETGQDPMGRPVQMPINREMILNSLLNYVGFYNHMETLRYNKLVLKETGQNKGIGCVEV